MKLNFKFITNLKFMSLLIFIYTILALLVVYLATKISIVLSIVDGVYYRGGISPSEVLEIIPGGMDSLIVIWIILIILTFISLVYKLLNY